MRTGNLDRLLTILRATVTDDGFQARLGPPAEVGTIWASKKDISDGERFANGATDSTVTTRFQVRWTDFAAGIIATDLIELDGKRYGIVGLKELGRREGIEISARAEVV